MPADPEDWMLSPGEVRRVIEIVRQYRESDALFDVAVALSDEGDAARRSGMVEEYADAGVTWWMEGVLDDVGPLEEIRDIIGAGPRRD